MPVKKKITAVKKSKVKAKAPKPVAQVTHFYNKISVGILKLKAPLKVGDTLRFVSKKGEFTQTVDSMQFEHEPIAKAPRGKQVGIRVKKPVHERDLVFLA